MSKGISNYQIDDFFKEEDNDGLKKIIYELILLIQ